MIFALIIILAFLYSSLVEYCLHRFIMHRSYQEEHIKYHHKMFHGKTSYELNNVKASDIFLSPKDFFMNCFYYLIPSLVIFTQSKVLGIIFFIVCILYNLWEEFVHLHFHKSNKLFIEKLHFYKRLKEHHRIHHYIYNTNFGIGSSFWDIIFRTKKR